LTRILVSCGEPSGDLYAGALAAELRRRDPGVQVAGLGGDHLRAAGGDLVGEYRGLAVTGLAEAVSVLPRSLAMYRRLIARARRERPDAFVAIDFPDFNFRLAAAMRRLGIPVVYYVSPQIWAWRRGRLKTLRRLVHRMLVIFPFEEQIYRDAGVPVEFVGHPLVEMARADEAREPFLRSLGLGPEAPTVALLPGSRPNEVRAILPTLAEAATRVADAVPRVQFVLARAPHLEESLFAPFEALRGDGVRAAAVEARTDTALAASDLVLTASGTATVQAALHERPMVIVYRLSPLTYTIGRRFVHVETFGMVNLVAGRRIVPELVQHDFTPDNVAGEALRLLQDAELASRTRAALSEVKARLGGAGASGRAAEAVLAVARGRIGRE
jgi:lipid-A-disaccharide synthase